MASIITAKKRIINMINYLFLFSFLLTYSNYTNVIKFESKYNVAQTVWESVTSNSGTHNYFTDVTESDLFRVGYKTTTLPNGYVAATYEYTTYLKIVFPNFSSIIDANLILHKYSGDLSVIGVNYYTGVPSFVNGIAPTPSGSLGVFYLNNGSFCINLASAYNSLPSGQRYLYISLSRSYTSLYGEFYNFNQNDLDHSPYLEINTEDIPSYSTNLSIPHYEQIYPNNTPKSYSNCFRYALFDFSESTQENPYEPIIESTHNTYYSSSLMANEVIPEIIRIAAIHNGKMLRIIDGSNSLLYENEYRIAFRLKYDETTLLTDSYHFMRQDCEGWSEKQSQNYSILHNNFNPETDDWIDGYNSETCFFAVSTI